VRAAGARDTCINSTCVLIAAVDRADGDAAGIQRTLTNETRVGGAVDRLKNAVSGNAAEISVAQVTTATDDSIVCAKTSGGIARISGARVVVVAIFCDRRAAGSIVARVGTTKVASTGDCALGTTEAVAEAIVARVVWTRERRVDTSVLDARLASACVVVVTSRNRVGCA
jgi:hypothetical protein